MSNPFENLNAEKFNEVFNKLSDNIKINESKIIDLQTQNNYLKTVNQFQTELLASIARNTINFSLLGNSPDSFIYDKSKLMKMEKYNLYAHENTTMISNSFDSSSVFDEQVVDAKFINPRDNQTIKLSSYATTHKIQVSISELKDTTITVTFKANHFDCNACFFNTAQWIDFSVTINQIKYSQSSSYITFPLKNVNTVDVTFNFAEKDFTQVEDGTYTAMILINDFQLLNITTPKSLTVFSRINKRIENDYIESININQNCDVSQDHTTIHNITNDEAILLSENFDTIIYIPNTFPISGMSEFYYMLILTKTNLTEPLLFQDATIQFQI